MTRRRALLFAWLGAVALLFALLSFLLQLASGVVWLDGFDWWFSCANAIVGIALLAFAGRAQAPALFARARSKSARRRGAAGGNLALQTIFALAFFAGLALLVTKFPARFDWTEARTHSLSEQSHTLLANLTQEVRVVALYPSTLAEEARSFLTRYELAAPARFQVEFVDPNAQPGRLQALGVRGEDLREGLLHVSVGEESVEVFELTEPALTGALVKLTRGQNKRVVFLEGHDERPVRGAGAEDAGGFGAAAQALRNENYRVDTLLLASAGEIPSDVDVVIVASPARPFHATEHAALSRYVDAGGALFLLFDPHTQTDLQRELKSWGVELGNDVIVDRLQGLIGQPMTPFADVYADHPITRKLRSATLFHVARSVRVLEGGAFTKLVQTSEDSWAERDLARLENKGEAEPDPATDIVGRVPVLLAGTVGEGENAARLVVAGDSDFATNRFVREFAGRDLFVNAVNWLLGDVEAIAIRPARARASRPRTFATTIRNAARACALRSARSARRARRRGVVATARHAGWRAHEHAHDTFLVRAFGRARARHRGARTFFCARPKTRAPQIFGAIKSEDIVRFRILTSDGVSAELVREGRALASCCAF